MSHDCWAWALGVKGDGKLMLGFRDTVAEKAATRD